MQLGQSKVLWSYAFYGNDIHWFFRCKVKVPLYLYLISASILSCFLKVYLMLLNTERICIFCLVSNKICKTFRGNQNHPGTQHDIWKPCVRFTFSLLAFKRDKSADNVYEKSGIFDKLWNKNSEKEDDVRLEITNYSQGFGRWFFLVLFTVILHILQTYLQSYQSVFCLNIKAQFF